MIRRSFLLKRLIICFAPAGSVRQLCNCVKITSTFPSLGDASTLVGMTVLTSAQLSTSEEVILIIILF